MKTNFSLYKFPIFLLLGLEQTNALYFSTTTLYKNHYIIYISSYWKYLLNLMISRDFFFSKNYVVDSLIVDLSNSNVLSNIFCFKKLNFSFVEITTIFSIFCKVRLSIITPIFKNGALSSCESIFLNLNWLERENSEMFGLIYKNKKDCRRLLLDYSRNEHPMRKSFPCSGIQECYYDFFENQIMFIDNVGVEL